MLLSYILFGGKNIPATFRYASIAHNTRLIAKTLYSLKLFLFQSQVQSLVYVTARDVRALLSLSFKTLLYTEAWNEVHQAAEASLNNLRLLEVLTIYPDKSNAQPVIATFKRHFWCLTEHLVGLAFFDQCVPRSEAEIGDPAPGTKDGSALPTSNNSPLRK